MLNSGEEKEANEDNSSLVSTEENLDSPLLVLVVERVWSFIITFFTFIRQAFFQTFGTRTSSGMARRLRACEELGPVYLLRSVKDQVQLFQEKRGYTPEENNFVNLCAIIVQQAGHAMYAVFNMFLALLPGATILLHVIHFILDRLLDIVTTRQQSDLIFKGTIFILQVIAIVLVLHFVATAIFAPILHMQMSILSKMSFMESRT